MHPKYNSITGQMALLTRYNLAIILYAVAPSFEIVSLHPLYFAILLVNFTLGSIANWQRL